MKISFYRKYLIASLILFTIMFLTGLRDENRNFVDNEGYLFLLLLSTLNVLGSVILYAYHLRMEGK